MVNINSNVGQSPNLTPVSGGNSSAGQSRNIKEENDILWAMSALTPAQRAQYESIMAMNMCSEKQALEQVTGKSFSELTGTGKSRFVNTCADIEALWEKCEAKGDFSEFQADVTRRFAKALEEDRQSRPIMQD